MTEALLLVIVGSLVPISVATLVFSFLALRKAQLYVELVEQRLEHLREGQALILALLREQNRSPEEREQRPEREETTAERERDRLELAVRARRSAERVTDEPEPRNLTLDDLIEPKDRLPLANEPGTRGPSEERPPKGERREEEARPRLAGLPDTTSAGPARPQPEDEGTRRAVWHPHPDDDVSPARVGGPSGVTVKMFRMHYDKYLDNYEGYVKLAARLFRMRDDAEIEAGSAAEGEWDERLRRVTDGIQRTTARLDILEEYNPELATDDRISRRAAIVRDQRELELQRR